MAKPTKYATPICIGVSIAAFIGIVIGLLTKNPIWTIIFLLPAVVYEVYRTEGRSTKAASIGLLVVYILELILVLFRIEFDLAQYLGRTETYVASYRVPLGDLRVVGPAMMAVLSMVLYFRTRGKYTKWLAIIIFITSFAIVYTLDPEIFHTMIKMAFDQSGSKLLNF